MTLREAFGVRAACCRFRRAQGFRQLWSARVSGHIQQRQQAARTPNASRGSVAALLYRRFAIGTLNSSLAVHQSKEASGDAVLERQMVADNSDAVEGHHVVDAAISGASRAVPNRHGHLGWFH